MIDAEKALYTKIGHTEVSIDKVIQNLLVLEEYVTFRNIVSREIENPTHEEDDLFSSHSNIRTSHDKPHFAGLIRGRLHLALKTELSEEYLSRVEQLKRLFVKDAQEKLEHLKGSIEDKQKIITQSLESLYYIHFDHKKGLLLD